MEKVVHTLSAALDLGAREHLALVGGGGKTVLMFALAEELQRAGRRVITSTTTKVWHHQAMHSPCVAFAGSDPRWRARLSEGLQVHGHGFLAQGLLASGKVEGIPVSLADELYGEEAADYLVIEADGSAGRPVKAPAEHEPVIPPSATKVVAMMGLEAVGREMGPEVVFRMEHFARVTGLGEGGRMTAPALSRLFLDPGGLFKGAPPSAERVVFLNKLDLLSEEKGARELSGLILTGEGSLVERVILGSLVKGVYRVMRSEDGRDLRQGG